MRQLSKLPKDIQKKISHAIGTLAAEPRPAGCKKISTSDAYRIRIGDYRVIYEIDDKRLVILAIKIGHRREVYK
jgi:mRNA interferase RelE/StbE